MKRHFLSPVQFVAVTALCSALSLCMIGCHKDEPSTAPSGGGGTSATAPATAKPTLAIGVSVLTSSNPFFEHMSDAMVAEGKKQGYDVNITSGDNDPAKQKGEVDDFIVKKVSAIVLCPCDSRSVGTTIVEANNAGIPVFTADIANLDKTGKVVSHVATDNLAGGKLAGEAIVEALGGKGKVAIIDHPEVESAMLRSKGFREVIAKNPGITIVGDLPGEGERDIAFKAAQDVLEKNPDLAGIFAINDPMALGTVAAIEKAGRTGKIKVISFDGDKEARQAVKDGKIYADVVQYPDKIGQLTIDHIADYLAGKAVDPQMLIPAGVYKKADADKDPQLK